MAQVDQGSKAVTKIPGAKIAILQARWYEEYTDKMVEKCLQVLEEAECATPQVFKVPGCYELPLAMRRVCRLGTEFDAVIVFGVIIKGQTYHFDIILNDCSRGLSQISLEEDIPVIMEVLPVDDVQHVIARSSDDGHNKGLEAGLAAADIIKWRRDHPAVTK